MDATYGDKILFKVSKLENVRLVIGLAMEFEGEGIQEFLFTSSVNKKGGFIRFPYPYNGYMTLNYDSVNGIEPGSYSFSVQVEKSK